MSCGVDEAGRGPVIGPMVVAGICANDDFLREIRVRDSKKVSPKRRELLAEEIKKKVENIVIRMVSAEEIDEMREKISLNEIEVLIFADVIYSLKCKKVYVDAADVNETRFADDIQKHLKTEIEIISEHKADDTYPAVSAASIIAKVERDRQVRMIADEIGDFGSGYPADPRTHSFLLRYYREHGHMPPHVRMSWKSIKKIIQESQQIRIDSF